MIFSYYLIGIFFTLPLFSQNALATILSFGEHSISLSEGTQVKWSILDCYNFEIEYNYVDQEGYYNYGEFNASIGDQFRFTYKGIGYYGDNYYYNDPSGMDPCLVASLEYYDVSEKKYYDLLCDGSSVNAFLMRNISTNMYFTRYNTYYHCIDEEYWYDDSKSYYDSNQFFGKYLIFALPTTLNLALYATTSLLYDPSQELYDLLGITTTSNSLNLTKNDGSYNYAQFRANGVTNLWDFKRNSTRITAEFLSQSNPSPLGASIPFGNEFLIFAGISILGLIFVVNRKRLRNLN